MRIQICGRLAIVADGERIESRLPSRQGRLLFAYLVANRARALSRDELMEAMWPEEPPAAPDAALRALLSKLRSVLGPELLATRDLPRLTLPPGTFVDLEAAFDALHRAESAVARNDFVSAWAPARVALHTCERGFAPGESAPWVEAIRRRLEDGRLRALEAVAAVGMGMGGAEIAAVERSGRRLTELAPLRESGWLWLMRAHAAQGNVAEALMDYEAARKRLSDEVGAAPGRALQEMHAALLADRAPSPGASASLP